MKLGQQIVYLTDFDTEADKLERNYGTTNLYSVGSADLDQYFHGGYGRQDGYEIVVLFGRTGIGKSTFALNMILDPIRNGKKIGLLALEDDGADTNLALRAMVGKTFLQQHQQQINFTPLDVVDGKKLWGLEDLLALIENWFTTRDMDIILLDHLQFAFESAVAIKNDNEYTAQRVFMRRLNYLLRRLKKTIIIVSHVNKNGAAKGMDQIIGSGGIAGAATKTIEIKKERDSDVMLARFWKSRFTKVPDHDRAFRLNDRRLIVGPNEVDSNAELPF